MLPGASTGLTSILGFTDGNPFGNGSAVRQVDSIIGRAIETGASDIHLEPYENRFRVRYRLDGVLHFVGSLQPARKDAIISRIKIMAHLDIAEKRRPQDGRIRTDHKRQTVDLRVSTLPTDFGEKVVLRILDKSGQRLALTGLGFEKKMLARFRRMIRYPYGMILVTGPTGSGKTTTLYASLNEINTPEVNITTIEDPIEYNLEGINQTHVRGDIGLTFASSLRAILRQDPDIIMVGEIRDRETAEIAIRAALTGHLVFSTLHTNDAPSAITRLLDMGIEPFLVSSSVRMVLAQRLVRKVCDECKNEIDVDRDILNELKLNGEQGQFMTGRGCDRCSGTGYRGRTALLELMPVTGGITGFIGERAGADIIKERAKEEGMKTLRETGVSKVQEGITTPDEVLRETQL